MARSRIHSLKERSHAGYPRPGRFFINFAPPRLIGAAQRGPKIVSSDDGGRLAVKELPKKETGRLQRFRRREAETKDR